ncbi:MAG: type VI secretion system-associated protein TagF [Azoarcus sp.]|jgi:type VI secretion system protein ImpM|nr:type VI secretion system-associated protein TagF [Azoarcus sp.]
MKMFRPFKRPDVFKEWFGKLSSAGDFIARRIPVRRSGVFMGWFGKLPSVGDFVGRGIPVSLKETIHGWMSSGMGMLAHSHPKDWQAAYLVSPVWHFVIGPGIWSKSALVGCLAPSVDKVGRYSPLIVLRSSGKNNISSMLPPENRWLYRVDTAMRRAVGERIPVDGLHDLLLQLMESEKVGKNSTGNILGDLGIGIGNAGDEAQKDWFAWPELLELLKECKGRSFWWSEPSGNLPLKQIVHCGTPDESLFCSLMDGGVPDE